MERRTTTHRDGRRKMGLVMPSRFMHNMVAMSLLLSSSSRYFNVGSRNYHVGAFGSTVAFVANNHNRPCITTSRTSSSTSSSLHMSSVGGGDNPDDFGKNKDDNPLNDWMSRKDTENVRRLREEFAEGRLPISYGAMNTEDETNNNQNQQQQGTNGQFGPLGDKNNATEPRQTSYSDDAINATSAPITSAGLSRTKPNPYLNVVSRLTPSDLISRFTSSASPRVQDAVRTTVLGLIGGLPQMAFETKTIATGERLASLMFQLQMTGYMFKNAEYRLSLSQSLGGSGVDGMSGMLLPGGVSESDVKAFKEGGVLKGKIKVRYGGNAEEDASSESDASDGDSTESETGEAEAANKGEQQQREASSVSSPGLEVEVDAKAYMSELRGEVSRLREELDATKQAKEEEIRKDLLMYIRTLPPQELRELTGTMSPEVLEAMKGLVTAVLAGIGEDEDGEVGLNDLTGGGAEADAANKIGPETVTEQSGEALAQLCMWQLVVGFNLRELEVREEFRASMKNRLGEGGVGDIDEGSDDTGDGGLGDEGGVQFGPGALE